MPLSVEIKRKNRAMPFHPLPTTEEWGEERGEGHSSARGGYHLASVQRVQRRARDGRKCVRPISSLFGFDFTT